MVRMKYTVIFSIVLILIAVISIYLPTFGMLFMGAVLLSYVLEPLVLWGEKRKIPRWFSAFFLIFGIVSIVFLLIAPKLPGIIENLVHLAQGFPAVYDKDIAPMLTAKTGVEMSWVWIMHQFPSLTEHSMELETFSHGLGSLIGMILHGLLFLVMVFIISRDWETIVASSRRMMHDLTPDRWNNEIDALFIQIGNSLSRLIRGQFEVSSILAVYYLIVFQIIGVMAAGDFAGPLDFIQELFIPSAWMLLGVITGYLNMIPYLGVPAGGVIAAVLGLITFQFEAVWIYPAIAITIFLGVTFDHKMLTPKVIGRSVSVHELWVYVAIYAGFAFGGVVGVILALPMMTVISEVVKHSLALWREHRDQERAGKKAIKAS